MVFHNATHAEFSWHRVACQSTVFPTPNPGPLNYNMNFSMECKTAGDNSGNDMITSDKEWLIKPPKSDCENRYAGSTFEPVMPDSGSGNNGNDDGLSSLNIVLIIVCVTLFTCLVGAGKMIADMKTPLLSAKTNAYGELNDDTNLYNKA